MRLDWIPDWIEEPSGEPLSTPPLEVAINARDFVRSASPGNRAECPKCQHVKPWRAGRAQEIRAITINGGLRRSDRE
jgi:hypothetical protein